jgi:CRISPR system Cascade subunit CasA
MNLTTDAWIPIVWNDARPGTVNLIEAFERGAEIRDLAVRPHERIALMRLLVCIAQAGLGGPRDYIDWKECRPRIGASATRYLDDWHQAFELFGSDQRFLQVSNLKKSSASSEQEDEGEGNSASKLDLALATGNNSTLFDNAGGTLRDFTPAQLALMLVTFQCFSPGGRIGLALWNGTHTAGKGSSNHAPCLAGGMLHMLLRDENLLAVLQRNLLTKAQVEQQYGHERWGKPIWELMPQSSADEKAVRNANQTYLGRLVPLARAVRLADDSRHLILANGLDYPAYADGWREASATVVVRTVKGQPTRDILRTSIDKGLWRELHALTVKGVGQKPGGPLALQNISDQEPAFDLWVGGLVTSQAKLVDTRESVFHVPQAMLAEASQMIYEQGVRYAENVESRLTRAVRVYHKKLGDNLDRPEMRNRRLQIRRNAVAQFWTDIEQAVPQLLRIATEPESLGLKGEWHQTDWGRTVRGAVREAFERACPHQTPRQICAYAFGLQKLFAAPTEPARTESEEVEA